MRRNSLLPFGCLMLVGVMVFVVSVSLFLRAQTKHMESQSPADAVRTSITKVETQLHSGSATGLSGMQQRLLVLSFAGTCCLFALSTLLSYSRYRYVKSPRSQERGDWLPETEAFVDMLLLEIALDFWIVFLFFVYWGFGPSCSLSRSTILSVGTGWVAWHLLFECVFFRWVRREAWSRVLGDYVKRGVWTVPAVRFCSPWILYWVFA